MMPLTRPEIEVLLDTPSRRDFVVSAYADLSVKNGFERHVETHLRNQERALAAALADAGPGAKQALEENLAVVREAVAAEADPKARGLAVFASAARGLRHVVRLDFPVENRLVVDEEPYTLPLLLRWYGEPTFLVALVDSDEAHLFEVLHGPPDRVRDLTRPDVDERIERDKPRFTAKKRFAQAFHERLFGTEDDAFFKDVIAAVRDQWTAGHYQGLILLGQPHITGPLRKALPRDLEHAVAGEAPHAMTLKGSDLADDVARLADRFQADRETALLGELAQRWKEQHLVAAGPTAVLDALQQGRAARVLLGNRLDIPGARCADCDYRLGAPVRSCPYCGGNARTTNAAQDVLRLAMRHKVPVHLVRRPLDRENPLTPMGDVVALVVAEANWAPDRAAAAASEGRPQPGSSGATG